MRSLLLCLFFMSILQKMNSFYSPILASRQIYTFLFSQSLLKSCLFVFIVSVVHPMKQVSIWISSSLIISAFLVINPLAFTRFKQWRYSKQKKENTTLWNSGFHLLTGPSKHQERDENSLYTYSKINYLNIS